MNTDLIFQSSTPLTLGVELELQLIRSHDYDLAQDAADLMPRLRKGFGSGTVKPEITLSMIELNSSIHSQHATLLQELRAMRDQLVSQAARLNLALCGGGTHAFHKWSERRLFPGERFAAVSERYGFLAKQFTVFGQHIHIGCPDGDAAIYLTHAMSGYLPHFIALAAASPFYQGQDTSYQCSRLTAVDAFPLSGHLPAVQDWAGFIKYFETMREHGIVASMKDFYWDIRPKPEYGTIEIRVCDTPLTVERAALLAALAQAIAAYLLELRPSLAVEDMYQLLKYNRFEACRYGLAGEIIEVHNGLRRSIGHSLMDWLPRLEPFAQQLDCAAQLSAVADIVAHNRSDADWLRERLRESRSLRDVTRLQTQYWSGVNTQTSNKTSSAQ